MLRWPWSSLSFQEPYLAKARGQRTRTAVVNAIFWCSGTVSQRRRLLSRETADLGLEGRQFGQDAVEPLLKLAHALSGSKPCARGDQGLRLVNADLPLLHARHRVGDPLSGLLYGGERARSTWLSMNCTGDTETS